MDSAEKAAEAGFQYELSEAEAPPPPPPPDFETEGTASEAPRPWPPSAAPPQTWTSSAAPSLTEFPRPAAAVNGPFPAVFNIYAGSLWSFIPHCPPVARETTPLCCLAEREATPLYAISFHQPCSTRPDMVLHNGPSPEDPPLATIDTARASGSKGRGATITLPALPSFGRKTTEESLEFKPVSRRSGLFRFSIDVGTGVPEAGSDADSALRRENFEWRASCSDEVLDLDGGEKGWKLVRLDGEAEGTGGKRAKRAVGTTSDGKEIVAVFSDNYEARNTRLVRFRFLGTGAAGHLGPRFAVMAVMTALRIWNERRPYQKKA